MIFQMLQVSCIPRGGVLRIVSCVTVNHQFIELEGCYASFLFAPECCCGVVLRGCFCGSCAACGCAESGERSGGSVCGDEVSAGGAFPGGADGGGGWDSCAAECVFYGGDEWRRLEDERTLGIRGIRYLMGSLRGRLGRLRWRLLIRTLFMWGAVRGCSGRICRWGMGSISRSMVGRPGSILG